MFSDLNIVFDNGNRQRQICCCENERGEALSPYNCDLMNLFENEKLVFLQTRSNIQIWFISQFFLAVKKMMYTDTISGSVNF